MVLVPTEKIIMTKMKKYLRIIQINLTKDTKDE